MVTLHTGITSKTSQNWLTLVAQERGFFAGEGLEHHYTSFSSMREGLEKVESGVIPICTGAADTPIVAIGKGLAIKIVGALNRVAFGHIMAKPGITSMKDLSGKRVGTIDVDLGSTVVVKETLRAGGLTEDDYTLAYVGGTPDRYDALINGRVEAAYLSPPYDFKAEEEGFVMLADCAASFPDYVISIYANQAFLSREPETAAKFLRASAKASRWIYDPAHKAEAIDILVRETGMAPTYGEKTYHYVIEETKGIARDCQVDVKGLSRLTQVLQRTGQIKTIMPPSDYVDDRCLKLALENI